MQRVVTQGQRVATRITGNAALQATSGATSQQHAQVRWSTKNPRTALHTLQNLKLLFSDLGSHFQNLTLNLAGTS
jgi:hypothetical protein